LKTRVIALSARMSLYRQSVMTITSGMPLMRYQPCCTALAQSTQWEIKMLVDRKWFRMAIAIGLATMAIGLALDSYERHRKLDRLQARIDALTVQVDSARKSIDQKK
jgi:hypothetical protein